jgi:hypothetical protein
LIKDQIDVTIKSMLTVQAVEQVSPVPTPQTPLPDLMENVDDNIIDGLDALSSSFATIEQSMMQPLTDDIVIGDKKTKKTGRKPKKV